MEKKKIVLISDHPLVPSGVGTQSKYLIEGLLKTGKYRFVCVGGAIKHPSYNPQKVEPEKYGDDWIILPVDGYGDKNFLRTLLQVEKPDAIVLFTDPRFFIWVWEMEDEIRAVCPLLYWHVWDNDPTPHFNKIFYESTDFIAPLSLKTYGLLQDIKYERMEYIPHAVDENVFKLLPEEEIQEYKRTHFGPHADKKFVAFWNNRNARRKQTGDVIAAFAKFADKVGKNNVALMMHTSPKDPEGQDVQAVAKCFKIDTNLIISEERLPPEELNRFYNAVDCTINISSNEGFGLATLESLHAGTPILVHMTGGLQFQVGNWWKGVTDFSNQEKLTRRAKNFWMTKSILNDQWFGYPVFPASRSCTGSQQIPYIYDDRVEHSDVVAGLENLYHMGRSERRKIGAAGRKWAKEEFSMGRMVGGWDRALENQIKTHVKGSKPRQAVL